MSEDHKWVAKIVERPKVRVAINLFSTILIGIYCSVIAAKIAPDGELDITRFNFSFTTVSFLVLFVFSVWLQLKIMNYDINVMSFLDDARCRAYVHKMKLDGMAAHIKSNPHEAVALDVNKVMKGFGAKS